MAARRLAELDNGFAARREDASGSQLLLRARAAILATSEAITAFAPYFNSEAQR